MAEATVKPDAIVALLRKADRYLIILRAPKIAAGGYWAPLSGRLEPGETQADALVREVDEEVGLVVTPTAKVWECDTDDGDYLLHWWTAEIDADGPPPALELDPAEVSDAVWVTPEEFLTLTPTFEGDRHFFARVLPTLA
ncbi:NUDIX hydrolase [Flindersiella endophytica]